jgi:hypothetical protein
MLPLEHVTVLSGGPCYDCRMNQSRKLAILQETNRNMDNNLPAAAFGHFIMKVSDINISYQFYTDMGLRPRGIFPDMAMIELRGGSHILFFNKNGELPFLLTSSHLGQRSAFFLVNDLT